MPKSKQSDFQLGRSLIRQHRQKHTKRNDGDFTASGDNDTVLAAPVASVTEESALAAVLERANLERLDYDTENKMEVIFTNVPNATLPNKTELDQYFATHKHFLRIPRKPHWVPGMAKEELQRLEEDALCHWRRNISIIENEEGTRLTPYEKNLDFWRQLWRVIELSDTVVQIVDARNPLLYFCEDLFAYVQEVAVQSHHPRTCLLLLNKSDLLTPLQREGWRKYFQERNVQAVFWSAKLAEATYLKEEATKEEDKVGSSEVAKCPEMVPIEHTHVLTSEELIRLFKQTVTNGAKVTVGLVGYPNVGKSATLNALFHMKKTAVSATPGRTKHLQTLNIDQELTLCDCPGLVMPSFAYSQADLIAAGILSIDHMRDCVSPVAVICSQFPRWYLAAHYGLLLPEVREGDDPNRKATAQEFLSAYAHLHGFVTGAGSPHFNRAARCILKEYANGDLLYRHPPPEVTEEAFGAADLTLGKSGTRSQPHAATSAREQPIGTKLTEFDKKYFAQRQSSGFGFLAVAPGGPPKGKERRKEKVKRKEKLRRTYAYLDKHDSD